MLTQGYRMAGFGELGEAEVDIADLAGISDGPPTRRSGSPMKALGERNTL